MELGQRLDIVALVKNSKISSLEDEYQVKLVQKIQDTFTEIEQQLFVSSFIEFINNDTEKDFIIDLDTIWKWIGFSRKEFAKKLLVKHFIKDVDYKDVDYKEKVGAAVGVAAFGEQNDHIEITIRKGGAGLNKETILMTIDTFKKFCLKANTKKADSIHNYYIKLEKLFLQTILEQSTELKLKLENNKEELGNMQKELNKEKAQKNKMLNRRFYNTPNYEYVYAFKDNLKDKNSVIKIGKSKKLIKREEFYSNNNKSGGIIFLIKCLDCTLIEKICHHILDKFRINKNQEWFKVDNELAIKTMKIVVSFIDSNIEEMETFIESKFDVINNVDYVNNNEIKDFVDDVIMEKEHEYILDTPINYDNFIKECCIKDTTHFVATEDIKCAFRIWSKSTNKKIKDDYEKYMNDNFKKSMKIVGKQNRNVYIGLSLNELKFKVSDPIKDYELFIQEKCQIGWLNRVTYKDFWDEFSKYKGPNFTLTNKYKTEVQTLLEKQFSGGRVYTSTTTDAKHLFGVLGISFNGTTGLKTRKRTTKKVSQFNQETKVLVKTWNSLSEASRELNIPISSLSNYCRFENIINNFSYKYQ